MRFGAPARCDEIDHLRQGRVEHVVAGRQRLGILILLILVNLNRVCVNQININGIWIRISIQAKKISMKNLINLSTSHFYVHIMLQRNVQGLGVSREQGLRQMRRTYRWCRWLDQEAPLKERGGKGTHPGSGRVGRYPPLHDIIHILLLIVIAERDNVRRPRVPRMKARI